MSEMRFAEWIETVPETITKDSLWKIKAYRYALFAADVAWSDVSKLSQDSRTRGLSDQLYRSVGSVSANIAEGYSKGTGKDRARFYEYALGSAREARDWYFKARHLLGPDITHQRLELFKAIIQLLLTMVPQQRGKTLRESSPIYHTTPAETETTALDDMTFDE
jgi:four helix bundle protein